MTIVSPHFFCALLTGIMHGKAVFLIISNYKQNYTQRDCVKESDSIYNNTECFSALSTHDVCIPYTYSMPVDIPCSFLYNKKL